MTIGKLYFRILHMSKLNTANRRICSRCVMPEIPPHFSLDSEGVCRLCRLASEQAQAPKPQPMLETDFVKILENKRGKGKYDCLVMCSGGKDSTSALYYMVKRYKLKTLAFTFDHGFETEEALDNVRRAVDILGVDFLYFKSGAMKNFFSKLLNSHSQAVICHPCSIWYMQLTWDIARRHDIPLIIAGWTKGQSSVSDSSVMSKCACSVSEPEFEAMGKATQDFIDHEIRKDPEYAEFPSSMEGMLAAAKKSHKAMVISPHWFLPQDQETYIALIQKELGWVQPKMSYPAGSTNCALNFLSVYYSLKNYGYTHYHVEFSKMIRQGLMTRDEALQRLEFTWDQDFLNQWAAKLNHRVE